LDFVPEETEIVVDYQEGAKVDIELHDGSKIHLSKLAPDWDPRDRTSALKKVYECKSNREIATGLLFIDTNMPNLHNFLNTVDTPLNKLNEKHLNPGNAALAAINQSFR
jgi:2-oxoglutarate ferredoxin oxidoreductase subunit beta